MPWPSKLMRLLWVMGRENTLKYMKEGYVRKTCKMLCGGCFESGIGFYAAGTAGYSVPRRLFQLSEVKDIHAHMMVSENECQVFDNNSLMDKYVKCGSMVDAHHVFDNMPYRSAVSWNVMILGYAKQDEGALALELYAQMHQQGVQPSCHTFVAALKACNSLAALDEVNEIDGILLRIDCLEKGRAIHSNIMKSGFESNLYVGNTLVDMYVKCGSMEDAWHVLIELPRRDVVSWTAIIMGYARKEEGVLALEAYSHMCQAGVMPNDRTFVGVLKACRSLALEDGKQVDGEFANKRSLDKGRTIHCQVVQSGFELDVFVGTTLVDMYTNCGVMEDAQYAFDKLCHRDVVSWTAMILGYAQKGEGILALRLYVGMNEDGVIPNHQTFVAALKACSSLAAKEEGNHIHMKRWCLEKGRAIHSQTIESGFKSNIFVQTTLVDMYAKCWSMEDARQIFDELPERNVVSWNTMITGYVQKQEAGMALEFYAQMHQEGVQASDLTFVGALLACSNLAGLEQGNQFDGNIVKPWCLEKGRAIHLEVIKSEFESNSYVGNTLLDMYMKCGSVEDARYVFEELPIQNVVSWNIMIMGLAQKEEGVLALEYYAQMFVEGVQPSDRTFVGALKACSSLATLKEGKQAAEKRVKEGWLKKGRAIHSEAVKHGSEADVFVGTTLVDMYTKCGSSDDARHVFERLAYRDVVSWTAMISAYAEEGESDEVLKLYAQIQEQGLSADSLTFVSILKACGITAALQTGKELHSQICRAGLETTTMVANTLIDMYVKCGNLVDAQFLFDSLSIRDSVTWNSLIAGYAFQGEGKIVFYLFERMMHEGMQPNGITFLSILTVCSHVGLVDKGQTYFQAMSEQYDIIPTFEHYTCMIDLFGRAGQVEEALAMVEKMPIQPDVVSWLAVLGACWNWKNVDVGRYAFKHAVRLDEKYAATYVLIANIHAHAHMWDSSDKIDPADIFSGE